MVLTSLKILCEYAQSVCKILEKGKYLLHTIACLTVFTRAFCYTHVENHPERACEYLLSTGVFSDKMRGHVWHECPS